MFSILQSNELKLMAAAQSGDTAKVFNLLSVKDINVNFFGEVSYS
jgi:hypothetical protein